VILDRFELLPWDGSSFVTLLPYLPLTQVNRRS
jgi:hypothetical protein